MLPSPNIPTLDSAVVYPGTVLFEGTNVSEGRGTTRPFELVGAPWVAAERFADAMNRLGLPGVHFRPAVFEPTFHKHAKTSCGGCQIHVLDREAFRPVEAGVALLAAFRACRIRTRSPGASRRTNTSTRSCRSTSSPGRPDLREQIDAGIAAREIARSWEKPVETFMKVRERFLLY